jgi:hypothetical protein
MSHSVRVFACRMGSFRDEWRLFYFVLGLRKTPSVKIPLCR